MKKILKNDAVQSLIASFICIVIGMFVGYLVLLAIEPSGAAKAILDYNKAKFFVSENKNLY